jgi:nicotinate-nucleotide pyrophosphorylase (carboxylating)
MNFLGLDSFLLSALQEDIGTGDITTECCVPESAQSKAVFRCKEAGVVCGLEVGKRVFQLLDPAVEFTATVPEGAAVQVGDIVATISGPARSILSGERLALNLMQHMSGVATKTAALAAQVAGTNAVIVDTRKTTPGMRVLEKYAVRMGGGTNHRFNLADGVLIKDNHIVAAGSITNAVNNARKIVPHTLKIEVETTNFAEVQEALDAGADIIMLDNMSCQDMKTAVAMIAGRAKVEASGNMGTRDIREVAETGVDLISVGALTHSVTALDISLQFQK